MRVMTSANAGTCANASASEAGANGQRAAHDLVRCLHWCTFQTGSRPPGSRCFGSKQASIISQHAKDDNEEGKGEIETLVVMAHQR
jgi:hypothetical protein